MDAARGFNGQEVAAEFARRCVIKRKPARESSANDPRSPLMARGASFESPLRLPDAAAGTRAVAPSSTSGRGLRALRRRQ